ncbi:zinc finger 271-like, partial, partial [Paramuricea clavata]
RFPESRKLTRHKISVHKSEQSFECRICAKTFTQRKGLKRHWRLHSRDGFLLCNTCGREISRSQGEGHANEMLSGDHVECDKCNRQFPDIQSLNQHKAKEHGTFYQCDVCKELEAGEATGIGYICCVCDAEFEIATELEDHMSIHDNMLPQAR